MNERSQHDHRCASSGCTESWTCFSASCRSDDLCDACERRQFEDYAERHDWLKAQQTLPEIVPALIAAHKEK